MNAEFDLSDGFHCGPLFVVNKVRPSKHKAHGSGWARRLAEYRRATPFWADVEAVKALYIEVRSMNKRDGPKTWALDHIYPLNGDVVCGLHIAINLQIIRREINQAKSNFVEGIHHEQMPLL